MAGAFLGGVHSLVTGINGSGKTLYVVADKLRPLLEQDLEYKGRKLKRRLCVGGVPALALPHELIEVPEIDPESFVDEWSTVVRERGDPPIRFVRPISTEVSKGRWETRYFACGEHDDDAEPILWTALNWWAWCEPGDVIVIDECQRLFRPMASGRRVPRFMSRLETARHYGVQFIYLTQFANLLHANLRGLIGPHEEVRRIFGRGRTVVYQWDRTSMTMSVDKASKRFWKHDKSAFELYKSAELHTGFAHRLPFALWACLGAFVALLVMVWVLRERLTERFFGTPKPPAAVAQGSKPPAAAASSSGTLLAARAGPDAGRVVFPYYQGAPAVDREPYAGRALQIEGGYAVAGKLVPQFGLVVDGERIATVSLAQLNRMGYSYTDVGPCAGVLAYRGVERPLSCARQSVRLQPPLPPPANLLPQDRIPGPAGGAPPA